MRNRIVLIFALLLSPVVAFATVTGTATNASFTCTGSTGPFPFTFPIDTAAAMTVVQNGAVLAPGNYTVAPVNNNYDNGGSVTLNTACPTGQTLFLQRVTPVTQLTQFTPYMPALYADIEDGLDQLTEIDQELYADYTTIKPACGTVPIGIPCGGTGATTAAGALANLGGLPLSGGTLTGALNGTSASFSGNVAAGAVVANVGTADPTGATDASSQINAAIAAAVSNGITAGQCLSLPVGAFYVPSLSNPMGVQFCGFGYLLTTVNQTAQNGASVNVYATKAQANTYSYSAPRLFFGQEYLKAWTAAVENNVTAMQAGVATTPIRVIFSGDSTTYGAGVWTDAYKVDKMFATSAAVKGIPGVVAVNNGHSGMSSSDWLSTYLAVDIAPCPTVYILRWGINDASYPLTPAQTIANMRTGLYTIRASCTVAQTSIVLEMPSSTNDNPNGRSSRFYEQLRNGYVQAAHDFQSAFIDTYGAMPDTSFSQVVNDCWMDAPYEPSATPPFVSSPMIHIHPNNCKNPYYNNLLSQLLIDPLHIVATNTVTNLSGNTRLYQASDLWSTYNNGFGVSIGRAHTTSGTAWPNDGIVTTFSHADSVQLQFNSNYSTTAPALSYRIGYGPVGWSSWVPLVSMSTNFFSGQIAYTPCIGGTSVGTAAGNPAILWANCGGGIDSKLADIYLSNSNALNFRFVNDTNTSAATWMAVMRSGITPTGVIFGAPIQANGYNSSDGTAGYTGSCASTTTLTVKNGLIVGCI